MRNVGKSTAVLSLVGSTFKKLDILVDKRCSGQPCSMRGQYATRVLDDTSSSAFFLPLILHLQMCVTLIHQKVCRHYDIPTEAEFWYKHEPNTIKENDIVMILWNICPLIPISTNYINIQTIIIIKNHKKMNAFTSVKELKKLAKYKDLKIENAQMWNMKKGKEIKGTSFIIKVSTVDV